MNRYIKYRITSIDDPFLERAHRIYTQSFPPHEQRTLQGLAHSLENPDFKYEAFLDPQEHIVAIRNTWHTPDFSYLEHFAVSPGSRSGGIGKYLLDDLAQESPRQIILEIDPVIDEISRRRLHFYLRNGFVANEQYDYIHPPYKTGDKPYPLLLMSSGAPLSEPLYHLFTDYHHHVVVPALPEQP